MANSRRRKPNRRQNREMADRRSVRKAPDRRRDESRRRRRAAAERRKKITRMPRRGILNIHLGSVIFLVIAVYLIFIVISYASTTQIAGYEVKNGSLALDTKARAVIIRDEDVYPAKASGYINYYAREGERVAGNELVYAIDESGELSERIIESQSVSSNIKESDLAGVKSTIQSFKNNYKDSNFGSVYDLKFDVKGDIEQVTHESILGVLETMSGNRVGSAIAMGYAVKSGILVYSTDGLEGLKASDVTEDTFNEDAHAMKKLVNGDLVSVSDNAFKISTNENWSIVVQWKEEWADQVEDGEYIRVSFLKSGDVLWGKAAFLENSDGRYLQLSFTNSMLKYATDRYIDVELMTDEQTGLKIPNSSIVQRDFYLIPEDYLTKGGDSDSDGFMRKTWLENGTESTEFVQAEVYNKDEGKLFVDVDIFNSGDILIKPDSQEQFTVSEKSSLTGVYNMNNGYADFRMINVLFQNKEYAIVRSGTTYGLRVYDHIVLNGEGVSESDFMFSNKAGGK